MSENKTIEEAKQHILNQICDTKTGDSIRLLTGAYGDLVGAEYSEMQLKDQREFLSKMEAETQEAQ